MSDLGNEFGDLVAARVSEINADTHAAAPSPTVDWESVQTVQVADIRSDAKQAARLILSHGFTPFIYELSGGYINKAFEAPKKKPSTFRETDVMFALAHYGVMEPHGEKDAAGYALSRLYTIGLATTGEIVRTIKQPYSVAHTHTGFRLNMECAVGIHHAIERPTEDGDIFPDEWVTQPTSSSELSAYRLTAVPRILRKSLVNLTAALMSDPTANDHTRYPFPGSISI